MFVRLHTTKGGYCADGATSTANFVIQMLITMVFLVYLVYLRRLTRVAAADEDMRRLTTADYAVLIHGLKMGVDPDQLKIDLAADLADNGVPEHKIDHIEMGRGCEDEMEVLTEIKKLSAQAIELTARMEARSAASKSTASEDSKLATIAAKYQKVKARLHDLIDEPDISTGHAFVVFRSEKDRNFIVRRFRRALALERSKNRGILRKSGSGLPPAKLTRSASQVPPAFNILNWRTWRATKTEVVVCSAPEPDEIIWENLAKTDAYESRAELIGYLFTYLLIAAGLVIMVVMKVTKADVSERLAKEVSPVEALAITNLWTIAASCIVTTFNYLLKELICYISSYEGQDTETDYQRSVFTKLSIAYLMNSVFVPIAVGGYLSISDNNWRGFPVDQSWYETGGVVAQAFSLMVINAFATDIFKVVQTTPIMLRYLLARCAYSQEKLNSLWEPPRLDIGVFYAGAIKTVGLGIIYGPLYPPSYAITSVALIFSYFCTRYGIVHWYRRPPSVDQDMMLEMRRILAFVVLLSTIVQVLAAYAATGDQHSGGPWFVFVACPVLWLIYSFFPLGWLSAFAEVDQVDENNLDVLDAVDAEGKEIPFDQVVNHTGFEPQRYKCPLLSKAEYEADKNVYCPPLLESLIEKLERASMQLNVRIERADRL